jgi:hypothetical protein
VPGRGLPWTCGIKAKHTGLIVAEAMRPSEIINHNKTPPRRIVHQTDMNIIERYEYPFEFHLSAETGAVWGQGRTRPSCLMSIGLPSDHAAARRRHLALIVDAAPDVLGEWPAALTSLRELFGRLSAEDLVSVIWAGREPVTLCAAGSPEEGWRAVRAAGMLAGVTDRDIRGAWLTGVGLVARRFFPCGRSRVLIVSRNGDVQPPGDVGAMEEEARGFRECAILTDVMISAFGEHPLKRAAAAGGGCVLTAGDEVIPFWPEEEDGAAVKNVRIRPQANFLGWERVESIRGHHGLGTGLKFDSLRPGERHIFLIGRNGQWPENPISFEVSWIDSEGMHSMARVRLRPGDSGLVEFANAPAAVSCYKASLWLEQIFAEQLPGVEIRRRLREVIGVLEPFAGDAMADRRRVLAETLLDLPLGGA